MVFFELIDTNLMFDNKSTNKIKTNRIKAMLCGHFIGIDKLERFKLLQGDPWVNESCISVKKPETVSRFFGNFSQKTTQIFRDISFKIFGFEKLLATIYMRHDNNNARLNKVPSKFSPSLGENYGKFILTWNFGISLID